MANRDTDRFLSCNDLVRILRHKLPSKIDSDEDRRPFPDSTRPGAL